MRTSPLLAIFLIGVWATTPALAQEAPPPLSVEKPAAAAMRPPPPPDPRLPAGMTALRMTDGEITVATNIAHRGEEVVSAPVMYQRTAVLREDVTGRGFFALGSTHAAAGAPGFWAGYFVGAISGDLWCFFPSAESGAAQGVCLIPYGMDIHGDPLATRVNPYPSTRLPQGFALAREYNTQTDLPQFEERDTDMFPNMRLSYRLVEWDRNDIDLTVFLGDERVGAVSVPRAEDGAAYLKVFGAEFQLTQVGQERRAVQVTRVERPTPEEATPTENAAPAPEG